jgi:predicted ATPase
VTGLERDLVADCQRSAEAMNAFLAVIGQRKARGSGTTRGVPDLLLLCAGKVVLIEVKRPKTAEHPRGFLSLGQSAFIARALEMGVQVEVIETVREFEALVNGCRRRT